MNVMTNTTAPTSTDPILETRGLTKEFGGLTAVDDVNLQVDHGEIRSFIGPNGAGKSTFLKLLVGQLEPTSGSIVYRGEDITNLEPHERVQRGISMKFQVPAIYTDLSVEQNLHVAIQQVAGSDSLEAQLEEMLDRFNLIDQARTRVENLPHGKQQWLEIAMATAIGPDLLLLDEPTAGMSVEETDATADLIRQINMEESLTLIVIEHDIDFVRNISGDRLVTVLHQGQIFMEGPIKDIERDEAVRNIYLGEVD